MNPRLKRAIEVSLYVSFGLLVAMTVIVVLALAFWITKSIVLGVL